MSATWRIAGVNFDHMHMGENLRMAAEHPRVELVGLCDRAPERSREADGDSHLKTGVTA